MMAGLAAKLGVGKTVIIALRTLPVLVTCQDQTQQYGALRNLDRAAEVSKLR